MTPEDLQQLAGQLKTLPGGAQAAMPDFFDPLLADGLAPVTSDWDLEAWLPREGGVLCLRIDPAYQCLRLFRVAEEDELQIAVFPMDLLHVSREHGASPLVLALLCLATGQVDDGRRLKITLPKVDAAAKDLMLMTVCRLCG